MWQEFRTLGLKPTADLRAIKRAYAVCLKRTRPDDDAHAFQHLQESFEHALAWARAHIESDFAPVAASFDESAGEDRAEPPPIDAALPPQAPESQLIGEEIASGALPTLLHQFPPQLIADEPPTMESGPQQLLIDDPATFEMPAPVVAELLIGDERAPPATPRPMVLIDQETRVEAPTVWPETVPPRRPLRPAVDVEALFAELQARAWQPGLNDWLEQHPHLLELRLRDSLGQRLAQTLDHTEQLPAAPQLSVLAEFFGWEPLTAAPAVRRLLARSAQLTQLDEEAGGRFVLAVEHEQVRRLARLLRRPFSWRQHLWSALRPAQVRYTLARLGQLDVNSERQLDRLVDPPTLRFWRQLVDHAPLGRVRLQLMLLRSLVYAWIPTIFCSGAAMDMWRQPFPLPILVLYGVLVATALFGQIVYDSLRRLQRRALQWAHYWRSPRADGVIAGISIGVFLLGAMALEDPATKQLAGTCSWALLLLVGGAKRWYAALVSGVLWLFVLPVVDAPWTLLIPTLATLALLACDRALVQWGGRTIEQVTNSVLLGALPGLLPLSYIVLRQLLFG